MELDVDDNDDGLFIYNIKRTIPEIELWTWQSMNYLR